MKLKLIYSPGIAFSEMLAGDCIERAEGFGHVVEPVAGVVGNGHEAKTLLATYRIKPAQPGSKIDRPGTLGCLLSHYLLWRECVNARETFAIFEHDGMLVRPIPDDIEDRFQTVLKLDGLDQFAADYSVRLANETTHADRVAAYINPVCHDYGVGNYFRGSYGYMIKPMAARLLLGWIGLYGFYPSDIQLNERALGKLLAARPSIARLHPFFDSPAKIKKFSLTQNLDQHQHG